MFIVCLFIEREFYAFVWLFLFYVFSINLFVFYGCCFSSCYCIMML